MAAHCQRVHRLTYAKASPAPLLFRKDLLSIYCVLHYKKTSLLSSRLYRRIRLCQASLMPLQPLFLSTIFIQLYKFSNYICCCDCSNYLGFYIAQYRDKDMCASCRPQGHLQHLQHSQSLATQQDITWSGFCLQCWEDCLLLQ